MNLQIKPGWFFTDISHDLSQWPTLQDLLTYSSRIDICASTRILMSVRIIVQWLRNWLPGKWLSIILGMSPIEYFHEHDLKWLTEVTNTAASIYIGYARTNPPAVKRENARRYLFCWKLTHQVFTWKPLILIAWIGRTRPTLMVNVSPFVVFQVPIPMIFRTGELVIASTVANAKIWLCATKLVTARGEVTAHYPYQKTFAFYNPEEHHILSPSLKQVSKRSLPLQEEPDMAGAMYPFPIRGWRLTSPRLYERWGWRPLGKLEGNTLTWKSYSLYPIIGCKCWQRNRDI